MTDGFPPPSSLPPAGRRGRLSPEQLAALLRTAIDRELYTQREVLLLHIPAAFKSTMRKVADGGSPRGQLGMDLEHLNAADVLTGGNDPLRTWLLNAHDLCGDVRDAEIFQEAVAELDRMPRSRPEPGRLPDSAGPGWRQPPGREGYPLPQPARWVSNWPALPPQHAASASIPCNLAVRWGLDRSGFCGIAARAPGLRLIDALMTAEQELRAALRRAAPPFALPSRVWLDLPGGSTPATTWPELTRQALPNDPQRAAALLTEIQDQSAVPGFVLTWQADSVTADQVINVLEGACQSHGHDEAAAAAFCLELAGAERQVTALIEQAAARLLERGADVDSFSRPAGSALPAALSSPLRLEADLAQRPLPKAPGLLLRLASGITGEELGETSRDEIKAAVDLLRDQQPDQAFSLISVLAAASAEGTRLAALAVAADSDWLLDAWLAGIGPDYGKLPGPARLIPAATLSSLRTSLVCALMRRRRGGGADSKALDEAIDRLLASADRELTAVVRDIRTKAVQRPAFFDADRGPVRLYLLRRCAPDLVLPVDEVTAATRSRPAFWRLAQSLDLRQEFLVRALALPVSARAVLGLSTAEENGRLRDSGRWHEIQDLRRL